MPPAPTLLTIAGFDPSSGAGITADLQVFAAHGCFGTSAITGLTVQSTTGVRRAEPVAADLLADTLACLQDDLPPLGIKIGMLAGASQVRVVAAHLRSLRAEDHRIHVVLDPVLRSSSGRELLSPDGVRALQQELLPLVDVVTPNTEELQVLTGIECATQDEIDAAMQTLAGQVPGVAIIATGGHRTTPDDTLLQAGSFTLLRGTRVETTATHGTGCAFSSALLCGLVVGNALPDAARAAKTYVEGAMRLAEVRGAGKGPMNLLWPLSQQCLP